jgi:hypothetical protein
MRAISAYDTDWGDGAETFGADAAVLAGTEYVALPNLKAKAETELTSLPG